MNCCADAGNCKDGSDCAARTERSCDELGVCQERYPRCGGCLVRHDTAGMGNAFAHGPQLAPGVVEGYRVPFLGTPAQRRELLRFAKSAAWWITWCGLAGLAAGLISGAFA
jgi:hypothetical protein